jgi:tetratricopeptide (TPR) repeat protein
MGIAVGLNAMRTRLRISWLLVASLCIPLLSRAQSPDSSQLVSVRQLSIPPKALQAFQKGVELLAKRDPTGSLPHFQRAIAEFASFYEAYYKMGVANLKLWRLPDAEQAYRKSIELSGGHYAQPLLALGVLLGYQGEFAEAEGITRKGLDLDPTFWVGHYSLACALFGLNRLEEAEKSIREALRWKIDSAESQLLLAEIHNREKDYRAVLDDLDEYLKLDPDSPTSVKARALRDSAWRSLVESQTSTALVQP